MKVLGLVAALVVSMNFAHADSKILALTPGTTQIQGVSIAAAATATVDGRSAPLQFVGAGLRSHSLGFGSVKVYVAQLFVDTLKSFDRTDADNQQQMNSLNSLSKMHTAAIQLTFLRSVSAAQIQGAFQDAFRNNSLDFSAGDLAQFLTIVQQDGDAAAGQTMTFVGEVLPDGTNVINFEDASGASHQILNKNNPLLVSDIFAIWLGNMGDDTKLGDLKRAMCGGMNQ